MRLAWIILVFGLGVASADIVNQAARFAADVAAALNNSGADQ